MAVKLIRHHELTGDTSSIEFTTISGEFTDLLLVYSIRTTRQASNAFIGVVFNETQVDIPWTSLRGTGTDVTGGSISLYYWPVAPANTATANIFGNGQIYISDYASSTSYKNISTENIHEDNAAFGEQRVVSGLYQNNNPITSIRLFEQSGGNFKQYSSATLYGITADNDGNVVVS